MGVTHQHLNVTSEFHVAGKSGPKILPLNLTLTQKILPKLRILNQKVLKESWTFPRLQNFNNFTLKIFKKVSSLIKFPIQLVLTYSNYKNTYKFRGILRNLPIVFY